MNREEISRKRAKRFFELKKLTLPVGIEDLIGEYADVEEDYIPYEGDAICINRRGKPLIILSSNVSQYRRRFTLAHELGHIQIPWHTGMLSCHTDNNEDIDRGEYDKLEKEANAFAAELLMPQDWLNKLVSQNIDQGVDKIIDLIMDTTGVSFSAAVYNIINVLPKGYVFLIKNKIKGYEHKKISGNSSSPIFLYSQDRRLDLEWLKYNSNFNGSKEAESLVLNWYNLKNILDIRIINNIIEEMQNGGSLEFTMKSIAGDEKNCIAYSIANLVEKLPRGYIFKVYLKKSMNCKYLSSTDTYVSPKCIDKSSIDKWYDKYSDSLGKYESQNMEVQCWYFRTEFEFNIWTNDKRDSKTILKNIVDCFYSGDERGSVLGNINGNISTVNNKKNIIEQEEFYSILRQKFLGREDIKVITEHKDFNQFLVKKTKELYRK